MVPVKTKMSGKKKIVPGGIVHTYLGYNPQRYPMPAAQSPDLVTPAFEYMLAYGTMEDLTEEDLANAIHLDPSQIKGLGPSLQSLLAMLEARKQKILGTYHVESVLVLVNQVFQNKARKIQPPKKNQQQFYQAIHEQQIIDMERLWYSLDQRSDFARSIVGLMDDLGNKYQVEELSAKYTFTGRQDMGIPEALDIKEELETIDRLIEQLKQAAKDAKLFLIDMDELGRFANEEQVDELQTIQQQIQEMLQHLADEQGIRKNKEGYSLTPKAMKMMQSKLLDEIFSDLQAARSGHHHQNISGDGAVELQQTKPYEFGDSLANLDVCSSLINAMNRDGPGLPIQLKTDDLEIHLTRNNPKCATVVCMDMSGSMRWGGQYISVKRMALALQGLIQKEYPGDFLSFVEIYSVARQRHISEIPELLPKPVTIHDSSVRLKVDMSRTDITEFDIPPHFTNLQQGLKMSRQLLQVQDTPNRQILLITDGLPTAHFEETWLYLLYPPDSRTEKHTLREGLKCRDQGITINLFLLSSWDQSQADIRFAHRLAQSTSGRVMFVGGKELDRYVVWDYLKQRRYIVG
jgi:uncharacterized protein with von Willebrand factor type A (vWA) domain